MPSIYTHCALPKCQNITVPFIHNIASAHWSGFRDKVISLGGAYCDDYIVFVDSDMLMHVDTNERKIHHTAQQMLRVSNITFGAELGNYEIAEETEYYLNKWKTESSCLDRNTDWVHCLNTLGKCHSSRMPIFLNSGLIVGRCNDIKALTRGVLQYHFSKGDQYYYNKEALKLHNWSLDYCSKMVTNLHQMNPRIIDHRFSHFYHTNGKSKRANFSNILNAKFISAPTRVF